MLTKQRRINDENTIDFHNEGIEEHGHIKYLGVTLDRELNF